MTTDEEYKITKEISVVESYFATSALSNSLLGAIRNPKYFREKSLYPEKFKDEDKIYFRVGSAVDCILTDFGRWDDEFTVVDIRRPADQMYKFIHHLPPNLTVMSDSSEYETAYAKSGYKIGLNKIIDKLWQNYENRMYYLYTKEEAENGKKVISSDEILQIQTIRDRVKENKFTYSYFFPTHIHIQLSHQVPIYFDYVREGGQKKHRCKALLDCIKIDHFERTIEPVDLKTTAKSVYDFSSAFTAYGYYRQAAFYDLAIRSEQSPVRSLIEDGYTVKNFCFIVVESKLEAYTPALIFETTPALREIGKSGGTDMFGRHLVGIDELIRQYEYCHEHNYWELPVDIEENNGRIILSV